MSRLRAEDNRESVHGRVLCWASRIVSVALVLYMALGLVLFTSGSLWGVLYFFVVLALVLVSWQRHLIGGVSLALLAIPSLVGGVGYLDVIFPQTTGLALSAGGILHLVTWWEERKRMLSPMLEEPELAKRNQGDGDRFPLEAAIGCSVALLTLAAFAAFVLVEFLRFVSTD